MYVCVLPGLRLADGSYAEVGAVVPEAEKWSHTVKDIHVRSGRLRFVGDPKTLERKPQPLPERPKFTKAERERLAHTPVHLLKATAERRGVPLEWFTDPHHASEADGGVQLTDAQRKQAFDSMPAEVQAMAIKARGKDAAQKLGLLPKEPGPEDHPPKPSPAPEPRQPQPQPKRMGAR